MAFVAGMIGGPVGYAVAFAQWPPFTASASLPHLVGGLLVGFGTRLSSGCTSGHGVCGLARLSRRSLAAVLTFRVAAIVTVFLTRHVAGR